MRQSMESHLALPMRYDILPVGFHACFPYTKGTGALMHGPPHAGEQQWGFQRVLLRLQLK